ncbi:MAG TPA: trimeric intracellular cation channel family protein, partial [Deinococcales bacterium]|nr:trimeric intracellular cation channel family protein [Deinococcales bacterium]
MTLPGGWSLLDLASLAGTFVFALSGAIMAVRKRFDLLGVIVLGCVTAVGGGSIRDSLTGNTPPVFFRDERYLWAAILASLLGAAAYWRLERLERVIRLFDSLGLALFAGTGASLGVQLGLGPLGVVFVGALSGVGGGVLRDLLAGEVPQILYRSNEIYASAAALGSLALLAVDRVASPDAALTVGVLVTLGLRLGSERLGLALPVPAAREGSASGGIRPAPEREAGGITSPGRGVAYAVRRAIAGASPGAARDAERNPMASLLGQPAPEVHLKAHNGEDV